MTIGLPQSRLITANVNFQSSAAKATNFSSCLILGTSTVIDTVKRFRSYGSLTEVGAEFGGMSEEYLAAKLWYGQRPQPTSLLIGRWANTASHGQLIGATLSSANQMISAWTGITTGSLRITVDGGAAQNLSLLNFSAQTNLNGVASVISAALTGAVMTWDSVYKRFVVTSNSTGATSSVSFVSSTGAGTDVSAMLGMTSTSSGAYQAPGIPAETALAAAQLFDVNWSDQWYALIIPSGTDADSIAVAGYIEGASTAHIYGVTTSEAGVLTSGDTTNLAYQLQQLGYKHTAIQYSGSSLYAIVSLLGRMLTTDWSANNTAITAMFKDEPGVAAETLSQTQANNLESYNCNVFVAYSNGTAIIEQGKMCSGDYIDTIIGADWLKTTIQGNLFAELKLSPTKIPQTDAGMHQLATVIEKVLMQGVKNGLLGPGVWTGDSFGELKNGDWLDKGYYVYTPPISSQSLVDRQARKSVAFQVAAHLAGAVHSASVQLNFSA